MVHVSCYTCIYCRRRFLQPGKCRLVPPGSNVETHDLFLEPEDELSMDEVLREVELAETRARFSLEQSED